jgi:methylated-DNA-[protein]-cysteine S-methyltransferase
MINNPKACRAVGHANNKNPIWIIIPCHRVIGSNGALVGYGGGLDMKKKLLDLEKSETF